MNRAVSRYAALFLLIATALSVSPHTVRAQAQDAAMWAVAETLEHPLVGTVWDGEAQTAIQPDTALTRLSAARFSLLGEVHDNPAAHRVQTQALRALVDAGRAPAVVWEMIRRPKQSVLNDPPKDVAALGTALNWAESGWPDWTLYAPIAQLALDHALPMLAGDLARATLRKVSREGLAVLDVSLAELAQRPLAEAAHATLLDALRQGHCNLMDEAMLAIMLPVQQARDASMTAAMLTGAASADGAVLIAGNGHTRRDWGVPHYLTGAVPATEVVSVGVLEVVPDLTQPVDYLETDAAGSPVYDLVWFVPRADREDPCAGLAKRMTPPK